MSVQSNRSVKKFLYDDDTFCGLSPPPAQAVRVAPELITYTLQPSVTPARKNFLFVPA